MRCLKINQTINQRSEQNETHAELYAGGTFNNIIPSRKEIKMDNHTECYTLKSIALRRAKDLLKSFDYTVVIKDKLNNFWVHTTPQDLNGDQLIVEMKGE